MPRRAIHREISVLADVQPRKSSRAQCESVARIHCGSYVDEEDQRVIAQRRSLLSWDKLLH